MKLKKILLLAAAVAVSAGSLLMNRSHREPARDPGFSREFCEAQAHQQGGDLGQCMELRDAVADHSASE